jgi:hypothetical protein
MSTQVRTNPVYDPIRWFIAGVATTLIAGVLAAGVAMATSLPTTQPGMTGTVASPDAVLLDPGLRLQRAGEIGFGEDGVSTPVLSGLDDHRKGEINAGAGAAEPGDPGLMEQRRGEINAGQ